jgi:hypothetical protein
LLQLQLSFHVSAAAAAGSASLQPGGTAAATDIRTATATVAAFRQCLHVSIMITHHAANVADSPSRLQLLDLLVAAQRSAEHVEQLLVLCACSRDLLLRFQF